MQSAHLKQRSSDCVITLATIVFCIVKALSFAVPKAYAQQGGSSSFNPMTVPTQAPAVCDSYLIEVGRQATNVAFRRLLFVSEALASAGIGAKEAAESVKKMNDARNLTELWAESLNGQKVWEDHMHCAAQIMSRYAPYREGDPESTFAVLLTVAYNQEAHARDLLAQSQKRRLLRDKPSTTSEEFSDAEELQKIKNEQDDAADSITKMGMLAAAEAEDFSKHDPKVQWSSMTCDEHKKIVRLLTPVSRKAETVFGTTSAAMLKILAPKVCKRSLPGQ